MIKRLFLFSLLLCLVNWNCNKPVTKALFELKSNEEMGINFSNTLVDKNEFNVYKYRNYYNGGGVAIGDINNDGLVDVYMVSNQNPNKLYLNKGNWKFEDITTKSNAGGKKAWSTGVTMADVNGDGFLDIYVCNSGDINGDNKENELLINNGDLTFTERAAEYGLNDKGFSTHASFFDYDKDGDLDAYILNNSFRAIGSFDLRENQREKRDELGGDKLMRNDNGKFVDVSAQAGIFGSVIGFGLGITIGDVNNDGWEDIFISNDFFERDYLYINQKNSTFKEVLTEEMQAISAASMGADIADINNDGWNDIFVTDMLPYDYGRMKTVTTFDDWNRYITGFETGYHHQFTRNMLHLNNKNNTFSDVSRMSGVEASDWSWGALFFDMQNDGNKDLFIANGIYKDLTNQDYLQYVANDQVMTSIISDKGVDYKQLIDVIPSQKIPNQAYMNKGNLAWEEYKTSGLWTESFSNGSAYGDIDNDGDLDLIVNNINMPCFIYENKANEAESKNNYLKLVLKGEGKNTFGIGACIQVTTDSATYTYECQPVRGFESTVDNRPNIGVGKATKLQVKVRWPSGKITLLKDVAANQILTVSESSAVILPGSTDLISSKPKLENKGNPLNFTHTELPFNEFNSEGLKHYMMSTQGPNATQGDINGDGYSDILVPNAKGGQFQVFLGGANGNYTKQKPQESLTSLMEKEIQACHLFDADGDKDLDMYVASGGVEVSEYSEVLFDDLLINDGSGNFTNSGQRLPNGIDKTSTSCVSSGDIDQDGDLDLIIGERVKMGNFGASCSGYILINDGKGKYTSNAALAPELINIGMITDVKLVDFDGDKIVDILIAGEFMSISLFKGLGKGKFDKKIELPNTQGWWNRLDILDIDGDGDQDIVAGNHGLNSRFRASADRPLALYYADYDSNGFGEAIMAMTLTDGKEYPYPLRHNLMGRLPGLKKKYPNFESFRNATMIDIFTAEYLKTTWRTQATNMQSVLLINNGEMKFDSRPLPITAQIAPIYAITHLDIDQDGDQDVLVGGNLYEVQPEFGRYDASYGNVLINDGKGNLTDQSYDYGFSIKGVIRSIIADNNNIYIFRNSDTCTSYQYKQKKNEL